MPGPENRASHGEAPATFVSHPRNVCGRDTTVSAHSPDASQGLGLCQPPSAWMTASASLGPQLPRL